MRVAVVGQDFPESFSTFIAAALERMGHQAKVFRSPASLIIFNRYIEVATRAVFSFSSSAARSAERYMARRILDWAPDLVISNDINLWPETVVELKKNGPVVVAWCPDALVNFGRQFFYMAPYDVIFLKDPYVVRHAREFASLPVEYLPEACDPTVHRPVEPTEEERVRFDCDIIHYGNAYPSKVRMLERLVASGYQIKAFGRGYPSWLRSPVKAIWSGEYLSGRTKAAALRTAKISLNALHYGEIESANARLFESAGCGAFQLVEWRRSMDELFEHEKEVVYYQSFSELKKLIDHWLPLKEERRAIGNAAARRAHSEHTYEKRLSRLLERSL